MLRHDLLENGYNFEIVEPKKPVINLLWAAFAACFIMPALFLYFLIFNDALADIPLPYIEFHIAVINIMFIALPAAYLVLKEVMVSLFCFEKNRNIQMKLYSATEIPVSAYREAYKTWQLIITHSAPSVLMYPLLILTSVISGGNINLLIVIFIMAFLMAFDLTLAAYIIFVQIKHNADYISLNNHIYSLTLYSAKSNKIKKSKTPVKIPDIKKPAAAIIFAGALLFSIYHFISAGENFPKVTLLYPVGDEYAGFTGGAKLAGGNIIHCGDDGSAIYYDAEKASVMRLGASGGAERLCIRENCRNNPGARCGHMPDFLAVGAYSDGILYGAQSYGPVGCLVRYDINGNTLDKLAEFEMGDENAHIRDIFIYSRYLYAVVSAGDMEQLTFARFDLAGGGFEIIYQDRKNPNEREKIENLIYNKTNMFSSTPSADGRLVFEPHMQPANGMLYKYEFNANKFSVAIELGYNTHWDENGNITGYTTNIAKQADIYGDYIYYTTNNGMLCRYNMKMKTKEELIYLTEFYIEGGWLYYFISWDNAVYRVKLDGAYTDFENKLTYIDFADPAAVYAPGRDFYIGEWGVKDDYIYAVSYSGGRRILSRIKISARPEPYVFW